MKRIISVVLALAMTLSLLAVSAFASAPAASEGELYYANDSRITDDATNPVPGETVYLAICQYDSGDKTTQVKKASLKAEDSDSKVILANDNSVNVVRLKDGNGDRWYFAELKLKTISAKTYDDDGPSFDYDGTLTVRFEKGDDDEISVSFTASYDEGDAESGTFYDYLQYFEYEKGDEIEIESDDGDLTFTAKATGTGKAIAAVDTETIDKLEEKYGDDATLGYFTCTGTFSRVKNAKITIDGANTFEYIYGYSNGKLVNIDASYSSKNDLFTISFNDSTVDLGTYVLSDKKLSASGSSSSSSSEDKTDSSSSSASASGSSSSSVVNPSYIPANPSTGAAI